MDFFERLRRLGNHVETQTKELEQLAEQASKGESVCDGGAAMMLVRKQRDLQSIKVRAIYYGTISLHGLFRSVVETPCVSTTDSL